MKILALAIVGVYLSSCSETTSVRHYQSYQDVIQTTKSALILPVQAEVNTVDVAGKKERMHDYEDHMEGVIANELIPMAQEKGLPVKLLTRKDIHDQNLLQIVDAMRDSYHEIREELYKVPLWDVKDAFVLSKNIGTTAVDLGTKTNSDILILVDYLEISKTSGARTMDMAMNIGLALLGVHQDEDPTAQSNVIVLGIIDAKTGDILWINNAKGKQTALGEFFQSSGTDLEIDQRKAKVLLQNVLLPFNQEKKS
jgi:hypothetical protein